MRIFVNGEEKKWFGGITQGNFDSEKEITFDEEYIVHEGDIVMFAVDPDGNDSYDGGRLSVDIKDADKNSDDEENGDKPSPGEGGNAENPGEDDGTSENSGEGGSDSEGRSNSTSIAGAFGEQGSDGWHYGMCDWNGKNFTELSYDSDNERYYNSGKPELKRDFVEPGNGRNAAYLWIAANDGSIRISGEYVKFPNSEDPDANGTCMRIFLNGDEKLWIGGDTQGNFSSEVRKDFYQEYEVKKGDEIIFAVDPDGNDSYDGGRLSVSIEPVE